MFFSNFDKVCQICFVEVYDLYFAFSVISSEKNYTKICRGIVCGERDSLS